MSHKSFANSETAAFNKLQSNIRTLLNQKERTERRLQAVTEIHTLAIKNPYLIKESFDRLLPTLEQLLRDRIAEIQYSVAKLLGTLATTLAEDTYKFFDWLFQLLEVSKEPEKLLLMTSLQEFLLVADKHTMDPFAPALVNVQNVESIEDPELLLLTFKILVSLSGHYPEYFKNFKDLIDLLVGWALDPNLPTPLSKQLIEIISAFHKLWVVNLDFAFHLLDKFLEHMEELTSQSLAVQTPERRIFKRLLSCVIYVCEGLGTQFGSRGAKLVPRLLQVCIATRDKLTKSKWRLHVAQSLFALAKLCGDAISTYLCDALTASFTSYAPFPDTDALRDLLEVQLKLIRLYGARFPLTSTEILRGPHPPDSDLRLHSDPRIVPRVREMYLLFLQFSSPENASRIVDELLEELHYIYRQLRGIHEKSSRKTRRVTLKRKEAYTLIIFNCSLLVASALVTGKNTRLKSVRQRVLQAISRYNPITDPLLSSNIQVQSVMVLTLRKLGSVPMTTEDRTHFERSPENKKLKGAIGATLAACLSDAPLKIKMGTLEWLNQLLSVDVKDGSLDCLVALSLRFCISSISAALIEHSTHDSRPYIRQQAALLLGRLQQFKVFSIAEYCDILNESIARLNDIDPKVRLSYLDLLGISAVPVVFNPPTLQYFDLQKHNLWKRAVMSLAGSNFFRSQNFFRIMDFLGQRSNQQLGTWLLRTYHACRAGRILKEAQDQQRQWEDSTTTNVGDSMSYAFSTFWAVWECARFCVTNRLRTPLGDAAKTFKAIEQMLIDHYQDSTGSADALGATLESRQLPLRLLLHFAEHLEKQIYLTYEGSALIDYRPPKLSIGFFRANRKVCTDWFSRMRQHLLNASSACKSSSDTIEHAAKRLLDLKLLLRTSESDPTRVARTTRDIELSLLRLVSVLCTLREADEIQGLIGWISHLRPRLKLREGASFETHYVPWLNAALLQSKGSYELAAQEYCRILDNDLLLIEPAAIEFMVNQVTNCYLVLSDWKEMDAWNEMLSSLRTKFGQHTFLQRALHPEANLNYIKALSQFDIGDITAVSGFLDQVPSIKPHETMNPWKCLTHSDYKLLSALLIPPSQATLPDFTKELASAKALLQEPLQVIAPESLSEAYPFLIQLACIRAVELSRADPTTTLESLLLPENVTLNPFAHDLGIWSKVSRIAHHLSKQKNSKGQPLVSGELTRTLRNQMLKLARKQLNYRLVETLLDKSRESDQKEDLITEFESAKLLYNKGQKTAAVLRLWELTRTSQLETSLRTSDTSQERSAVSAKMLNRLAYWIHRDKASLDISQLRSILPQTVSTGTITAHEVTDILSGDCLRNATLADPSFARGWLEYGRWCHAQGRKVVERITANDGKFELTDEENQHIRAIVDKLQPVHQLDTQQKEAVVDALQKILGRLSDQSMEQADNPESDTSQLVQAACPWVSKDALEELMQQWRTIRQRVLQHYVVSVQSYFKFLQLHFSQEQAEGVGDNVTATLRLLRLLVKYRRLLGNVLDEGFAQTPTTPWKSIIPQLFARLGHPDLYVQQQVQALICRIANESPHIIVYPAVVGSNSATDTQQKIHFEKILAALHQHNSLLVMQVQRMISEVTRITLLWEEKWFLELQSILPEISSHVSKLKDEIARIQANSKLSADERLAAIQDKYTVFLKPGMVLLERILQSTDGSASKSQTPHEIWFQTTFGESLTRALDRYRNPRDPSHPDAALAAWKELYQEFKKYLVPKVLQLQEISPELNKMEASIIPMPGLPEGEVTIHSFEPQVSVLPTKTKPKKIKLIGSDGKKYAYLLKGREDLHLDERIMQFLDIVNQILQDLKSKEFGVSTGYRARHYAVIPLSQHSGLIQWVKAAVPLFNIYKHWHRRTQASKATAGKKPDPHVKPIDAFYSKMIPALKEKGITNVMSRRDWPTDVQKRVFLQLVKETPRWILSKELWCASSGASEWWNKVKTYNRSTAVMSIIGYIIGLGDRHLDNILMDFRTGELVHIDYNVCFEKGLKLKVPEKVPFRMTQNMQEALGLTGLEGMFRLSCERVLRVMKSSKEPLLTLLEAFVYDPLVDWTANREDDVERNVMELNVTLSLFASRVKEMRPQLRALRDLLASEHLSNFSDRLSRVFRAQAQAAVVSSRLVGVKSQIDKLNEVAAANTAAALQLQAQLTNLEESQQKALEERSKGSSFIIGAVSKLAAYQERYERAIEVIRGPLSILLDEELQKKDPTVITPLHSLPLDTSPVVSKMTGLLQQITSSVKWKSMLHWLENYRAIVLQLPADYPRTNRLYSLLQLFQQLTSESPVSSEEISLARQRIASLPTPTDAHTLDRLTNEIAQAKQELAELTGERESYDPQMFEREVASTHKKLVAFVSEGGANRILSLERASLILLQEQLDHLDEFLSSESPLDEEEGDDTDIGTLDSHRALLDKVLRVLKLLEELWRPHSATIATDISSDLLFTLRSVLHDLQSRFLTVFTQTLLPQLLETIKQNDPSIIRCTNGILQLISDIQSYDAQMAALRQKQKEHYQFIHDYAKKLEAAESLLTRLHEQQEAAGELNWEEAEDLSTREEEVGTQIKEMKDLWAIKDKTTKELEDAASLLSRQTSGLGRSLQNIVNESGVGAGLLKQLDALFQEIESRDSKLLQALRKSVPPGENEESIAVNKFISEIRAKRHSVFFSAKVKTIAEVLVSLRNNSSAVYSATRAVGTYLRSYLFSIFLPLHRYLLSKFISLRSNPSSLPTQPLEAEQGKKEEETLLRAYFDADDNWQFAQKRFEHTGRRISDLQDVLRSRQLNLLRAQWSSDEEKAEEEAPFSRSAILSGLSRSSAQVTQELTELQECDAEYSALEDQVISTDVSASARVSARRQQYVACVEKISNVLELSRAVLEFEGIRIKLPNEIAQQYYPLLDYYSTSQNSIASLQAEILSTSASLENLRSNHIAQLQQHAELSRQEAAVIQELEQAKASIGKSVSKLLKVKNEILQFLENDAQRMREILSLLSTIVKISQPLESVEHLFNMASILSDNYKMFHSKLEMFLASAETLAIRPFFTADSPSDDRLDALNEQFASVGRVIYTQFVSFGKAAESHVAQQKREAAQNDEPTTADDRQVDETGEGGYTVQGGEEMGGAEAEKERELATSEEAMESMVGAEPEEEEGGVAEEDSAIRAFRGGAEEEINVEDVMKMEKKGGKAKVPGGGVGQLKTSISLPGQERNVHAVAVLNRVKAKLEGRDGPALDSAEKLTVTQQVDWVIQQATHPDNLSTLYEGWTAWI